MYKAIFTIICIGVGIFSSTSQTFQQTQKLANKNFHDLTIEQADDGTDDFFVGGNIFDNTLNNPQMFLERVQPNGNVVWHKRYGDSNIDILRHFDFVVAIDIIYATGYAIVGNSKKVFVAKIAAGTGNVLDTKIYDINGPNSFSRGLQIIYTNSDLDNDTNPDPGVVVGGFYSDCFNVDLTCDNKGFVLRTDINLNPSWTYEIDSSLTTQDSDWDVINSVTETADGFFLTGGTIFDNGNNDQMAVLAHKVDFTGTFAWDSSYVFGNSIDISVTAYFDAASQKIYALCNYSQAHNFAISVFENATGIVDAARSWYGVGNDLDRYGFSLFQSLESPENLVITGYDRDENWTGVNNNTYFSNSSVLVFQYNKNTLTQVGDTYQYLIPHTEPSSDDYNFWNGQFPMYYFPKMSFTRTGASGTTEVDYFHVGYRTNHQNLTNIELFKTEKDKRNDCDRLQPTYTLNPILLQSVGVASNSIAATATTVTLNPTNGTTEKLGCLAALSVTEFDLKKLRLYPNPSKLFITIDIKTAVPYKVYDVRGKTIKTGILEVQEALNISDLRAGIYFIEVANDDNRQVLKFIKE
jgi:hypothetical protein